MKKVTSIIAVLFLVAGMAFAQGPQVPQGQPSLPPLPSGDNFSVGEDSATANQTITLNIPNRVALHVDTANWTLDLDNLANQACFAVSKNQAADIAYLGSGLAFNIVGFLATLDMAISPDGQEWATVRDDMMAAGEFAGYTRATSYPAVNIDGQNNDISGDDDKGYIACFFGKVVQKFSNNADGWTFSAGLSADTGTNTTGFGQFGLADLVLDYHTFSFPWFDLTLPGVHYGSFVTADANAAMTELISHSGTTGGWLDDYVFEGFYFDGSEVADEYDLTVIYTLTGGL